MTEAEMKRWEEEMRRAVHAAILDVRRRAKAHGIAFITKASLEIGFLPMIDSDKDPVLELTEQDKDYLRRMHITAEEVDA